MARSMWKVLAVGLFFSCFLLAADDDNPEQGVARVSLVNGDVSIRRGDDGDWVSAAVNAPLVVYDHVLSGAGSRAEVQFDWANMLRLSSDTEVRISELESGRYQAQVSRGTVTLRVLRQSDASMEVDTPNISLRPVSQGTYRITVLDDGESEVTVRSGEAEAFTPRGVERVRSGRTMLVRGSASDPEYQVASAIAYDDWDRWNEERDRRLEQGRSYQYVSREIYGADDLDSYGRWINVPPYGWVWSPNDVGPGWAPYRDGRWSWLDWYGWTWVSYEPWGWAPFHYGRWFWGGGAGWCWFPGPVGYHHYWRPALVAFFGFGHGVGFGFGNVGWVPLAPYEPYYPWYGRGWYGGFRNRTYIDNSVHIVNNTNITNIYRNARVANGVTAIGTGEFVRGQGGRAIEINHPEIQRAALMRGGMPVTPVSESLRVSDRPVRTANLPRSESARFYTPRPAPAVQRVPFEMQRQGMEQTVRRTFGEAGAPAAGSVRAGQGAVAGQPPGNLPRSAAERGTAPRIDSGSVPRANTETPAWRRVGETPKAEAGASATGAAAAGRGDSWQRFGSERSDTPPQTRQDLRSEPRSEPRSPAIERQAAPRSSGSQNQSIRINPPIVRERSGGGSGGARVSGGEARGGGGTSRSGSGASGGSQGGGGSRGGRGR